MLVRSPHSGQDDDNALNERSGIGTIFQEALSTMVDMLDRRAWRGYASITLFILVLILPVLMLSVAQGLFERRSDYDFVATAVLVGWALLIVVLLAGYWRSGYLSVALLALILYPAALGGGEGVKSWVQAGWGASAVFCLAACWRRGYAWIAPFILVVLLPLEVFLREGTNLATTPGLGLVGALALLLLIACWRIPGDHTQDHNGGFARFGRSLRNMAQTLVPGVYDLLRGSVWRGYVSLTLFILVLLVAVSQRYLVLNRLAPGPYSAAALQPYLARIGMSDTVTSYEDFHPLFWVPPFAKLFWTAVALAFLTSLALHLVSLSKIKIARSKFLEPAP